MSDTLRAVSVSLRSRRSPARDARPGWMPTWSAAAGLRAVRTVLVVPGLFALTHEVIGDLQMATFAAPVADSIYETVDPNADYVDPSPDPAWNRRSRTVSRQACGMWTKRRRSLATLRPRVQHFQPRNIGGDSTVSKPRASAEFHSQAPNEARVLDYLLGGKDNFAADRQAAEHAIEVAPELPMMVVEGRKFLGRAVRFLVDQGIRQFIDIGCGLPTQNNAHEVAQRAAEDAHVVYVDNDPVVVSHANAILAENTRTGVIQADMRDPDLILAHPELRRLIDLDQPVAVLLISAFSAIPEDEVAVDIVNRLREAIIPGSWMVISHPISDDHPQVTEKLASLFQDQQIVTGSRRRDNIRTRAEIEPYFEGLELADPGLVRQPAWRPGPNEPSVDPERVWVLTAVGRKP